MMHVRLWRPVRSRWLVLALVAMLTLPAVAPETLHAAPAARTITISGLVDCGRASGQACEFGDTIRIRTTDLSGQPQVIVVDISWIKNAIDPLEQDDLIYLEIEERSDGGFQAVNLTPSEGPKKTAKDDEDDTSNASPTTPTLKIDDVTVTQELLLLRDNPDSRPDGDGTLLMKSQATRLIPSPRTVIATFTVTLSPESDSAVSVKFRTRDGSAVGGAECTFETDYISTEGTLTFAPGQTRKTIDVTICPGVSFEEDEEEQFVVELYQPSGADFGDPRGIGTILPGEDCFGRRINDAADGYFARLTLDTRVAC